MNQVNDTAQKMAKKWLETVMDYCFGEFNQPKKCPKDLTNKIFRRIERNPNLMEIYGLYESILGKDKLNKIMGSHIRKYWHLKNGKENVKATSRLIKTYTEHFN